MGIKEDLAGIGVEIKFHFSDLVCIKETRIPAGVELTQHAHAFEHASVLVSGEVLLWVDGEATRLSGYETLAIKPGAEHKVHALTDTIWLCIAPVEEFRNELLDHNLGEVA